MQAGVCLVYRLVVVSERDFGSQPCLSGRDLVLAHSIKVQKSSESEHFILLILLVFRTIWPRVSAPVESSRMG
jgi:hypothetical protein